MVVSWVHSDRVAVDNAGGPALGSAMGLTLGLDGGVTGLAAGCPVVDGLSIIVPHSGGGSGLIPGMEGIDDALTLFSAVEHALPNDDTLSISDKKIALNVQHPVWFHIKGKVSCIRLETADIYKIVYKLIIRVCFHRYDL